MRRVNVPGFGVEEMAAVESRLLGALHTPVDRVCHVAQNLRQSEARIEDDDELPVVRAGYDRVDRDGVPIGPNDAVRVCVYLPHSVGVVTLLRAGECRMTVSHPRGSV